MRTWLCTFEVKVDLPTTLTPFEMESVVAQAIAVRLPTIGYPGNCVVTLTATAGNASVLDLDGKGAVVQTPNPGQIEPLPVTADPVPEPAPIDTLPAPVDTTNPSLPDRPPPKTAPPEPPTSPIPVNPIGAV